MKFCITTCKILIFQLNTCCLQLVTDSHSSFFRRLSVLPVLECMTSDLGELLVSCTMLQFCTWRTLLFVCQAVLEARRRELATEDHMGQLARHDLGTYAAGIVKLDKELNDIRQTHSQLEVIRPKQEKLMCFWLPSVPIKKLAFFKIAID